eukprot:3146642-Rhodomonas_salina.2
MPLHPVPPQTLRAVTEPSTREAPAQRSSHTPHQLQHSPNASSPRFPPHERSGAKVAASDRRAASDKACQGVDQCWRSSWVYLVPAPSATEPQRHPSTHEPPPLCPPAAPTPDVHPKRLAAKLAFVHRAVAMSGGMLPGRSGAKVAASDGRAASCKG